MLDTVGAMPTDILLLYRATFDRAAELLGYRRSHLRLSASSPRAGRDGVKAIFVNCCRKSAASPGTKRVSLRCVACSAARCVSMAILRNGISTTPRCGLPPAHASQGCVCRTPELHLLIADHLLTLAPDDPLRKTETMVHLLASKDDVRAARYYGDPSLSDAEAARRHARARRCHDCAADRHAGERSARDMSFA